MLTIEHFKWLYPRLRPEYLAAVSDPEWSVNMMQRYGLFDNQNRLSYYLANVGAETDGLTVLRESMAYTHAARLRAVWPSRFGHCSDADLACYLNNPKTLADAVYDGKKPDGSDRMGNRPGTDDGFFFRGSGPTQTTGREDFLKYGQTIGIDFNAQPDLTDSMSVMWAISCVEVWGSGLNDVADAHDFNGYCALLNVGNRRAVAAVENLAGRQQWLRKIQGWLTNNPEAAAIEPDPTPPDVVSWVEGLDAAAAATTVQLA